jgi:hypothetical protein
VNAILKKMLRCYEHDWRIEDRRSQSNVQTYVEVNTKRWPSKYKIFKI